MTFLICDFSINGRLSKIVFRDAKVGKKHFSFVHCQNMLEQCFFLKSVVFVVEILLKSVYHVIISHELEKN